MLSEAGKLYSSTKIVNPYDTMKRFRYYQLDPIKSNRKIPKAHQTLDVNLRGKKDSFSLRYAKDITLNTNHYPNYSTIETASPRQGFSKGAVERYIGDVRDEDYSVELPQNCDHRCARANSVKLQKMFSTASSKQTNQTYRKEQSQLETASIKKSERARQDLSLSESLNLKKHHLNDLKSTEPSLIKKRSAATIDIGQSSTLIKPRRLKGIGFDSSVGHQYLKEVDDRLAKEKTPEMYDLSNQDESLINNNFRKPRINVEFGKFKNSIATRYDRADPYWHLINETSNCQPPKKDFSYDFKDYSARKPNEVKSKYPYRQSMHLYEFTPRADKF